MAQRGSEDPVCVAFILSVEPNLTRAHRTESYDYMEPVGVDPCWDVFEEFHNYLLRAFPLVYVFSRQDQVTY